jgi:serine protease Do
LGLRSPGPQRRTAIVIASVIAVIVAVGTTVLIQGPRTHHAGVGGADSADYSPSFLSVYRGDVSGVVRVDASTCSGTGIGSGFLVAPTLVATAAHVLDGAVAVGITAGATTTTGQVIGIDNSADIALVRTRANLPGHLFAWAPSGLRLATAIGVIGYPDGSQSSLRPGTVRAIDQSLSVLGDVRHNLTQTDAAVDGTYSGGPVLVASGAVAGLADTDQPDAEGAATSAYAVPAATAAPLVARWTATASPPALGSCAAPHGPAVAPVVTDATGPDSAAIALSLTAYFDDLDTGQYGSAYAVLGKEEKSATSEHQFATTHAGSYDYDITLTSVRAEGRATDRASVTFTSLQPSRHGPSGDTCDQWNLAYTMTRAQGRWVIDGSAGTGPGGAATSAC